MLDKTLGFWYYVKGADGTTNVYNSNAYNGVTNGPVGLKAGTYYIYLDSSGYGGYTMTLTFQ